MNRVILNKCKEGFKVGATVRPCTKGLWLWPEIIEIKEGKAIVIDCEGFGGIDESDTHDTRVFLIAMVLSSFMVYNSVGPIDEGSLNGL